MTPTQEFVARLVLLGPAELATLRQHQGRPLSASLEAFDLFTGLWWPLRNKSPRAPRRQVAWLVAKLYARCPLQPTDQPTCTLPRQLARSCVASAALLTRNRLAARPHLERAISRFRARFDALLGLPLRRLEPALAWAVDTIAALDAPILNWAILLDDLSRWENYSLRRRWAEIFLDSLHQEEPCALKFI